MRHLIPIEHPIGDQEASSTTSLALSQIKPIVNWSPNLLASSQATTSAHWVSNQTELALSRIITVACLEVSHEADNEPKVSLQGETRKRTPELDEILSTIEKPQEANSITPSEQREQLHEIVEYMALKAPRSTDHAQVTLVHKSSVNCAGSQPAARPQSPGQETYGRKSAKSPTTDDAELQDQLVSEDKQSATQENEARGILPSPKVFDHDQTNPLQLASQQDEYLIQEPLVTKGRETDNEATPLSDGEALQYGLRVASLAQDSPATRLDSHGSSGLAMAGTCEDPIIIDEEMPDLLYSEDTEMSTGRKSVEDDTFHTTKRISTRNKQIKFEGMVSWETVIEQRTKRVHKAWAEMKHRLVKLRNTPGVRGNSDLASFTRKWISKHQQLSHQELTTMVLEFESMSEEVTKSVTTSKALKRLRKLSRLFRRLCKASQDVDDIVAESAYAPLRGARGKRRKI